MLFNTLNYEIFLPIVFILYWFVFNKSYKYQNTLLLISSYFFTLVGIGASHLNKIGSQLFTKKLIDTLRSSDVLSNNQINENQNSSF
jgi:hypothetical protein